MSVPAATVNLSVESPTIVSVCFYEPIYVCCINRAVETIFSTGKAKIYCWNVKINISVSKRNGGVRCIQAFTVPGQVYRSPGGLIVDYQVRVFEAWCWNIHGVFSAFFYFLFAYKHICIYMYTCNGLAMSVRMIFCFWSLKAHMIQKKKSGLN